MAAVRTRTVFVLSLLTFSFSLSKLAFSLTENEALLKVKSSFTNAEALDDWDSRSSPCVKRWAGIICFGGLITGLHLSDFGLSGTIDIEALQQLRALRTLSLKNNSFSGQIPAFNKLGALKLLLLSHNKFSGQIPNDFFSSMTSLKKVWLSNNDFTGNIPVSLMSLPHLLELHLEGNQFSGQIPPLRTPPTVTSLDLSHNKLEGEIPDSFSKFSNESFLGNDRLCGKQLDRDCSSMVAESLPQPAVEEKKESANSDGHTKLAIGIGVLVVMGILIIAAFTGRKKDTDDDFSILEKETPDEMIPVRVRSIKKPAEGSTRRGFDSSRKGSSHGSKNGMGDLIMINDEKGAFGLPDLMKAAAEVLGNGGLGSAYKAVMTNGLSVVVKRMREMNKKEEKLLVSEYVPKGSLLYVLHGDRGACHADLNWPTRLKIIKGISSALGFLHSEYATYDLPHGNLKSSNAEEEVLGEVAGVRAMLRFMVEHCNHARFKSHDGNENGNSLRSYHLCLDSLKRGYDVPLPAIPPNESSCGEHLIFGQSLAACRRPPSQKGIFLLC
ncbi:hypothetical protein D5086_012983 [Populus alba]|uniref:Uncharacterized protein n=1 Tax=Populus alba TaxID=43335 RepID=A0ACC4C4G6_POPAL